MAGLDIMNWIAAQKSMTPEQRLNQTGPGAQSMDGGATPDAKPGSATPMVNSQGDVIDGEAKKYPKGKLPCPTCGADSSADPQDSRGNPRLGNTPAV